jgi:hypothetical protein
MRNSRCDYADHCRVRLDLWGGTSGWSLAVADRGATARGGELVPARVAGNLRQGRRSDAEPNRVAFSEPAGSAMKIYIPFSLCNAANHQKTGRLCYVPFSLSYVPFSLPQVECG